MLQELKLPLMVTGKSAKPKAFKNVNTKSLTVHYRSAKTAWLTQQMFKEWFHSEFAPTVTKHLRAKNLPVKTLLLLDNAPSHPSADELKMGDIEVVYLPANVLIASITAYGPGYDKKFKKTVPKKAFDCSQRKW